MDVVGDLGNPEKDAAAIAPLIQNFETSLAKDLTTGVIPAFMTALAALLDGRKVTITLSVELKDQAGAGSSS